MLTLAADIGGAGVLVDLLVILAAAAGVSLLFGRLRLASIAGYLAIGTVIGPHSLGLVASGENVEAISGLAIILLMFTIGLHLDFSEIRRGMVPILMIGLVSTLASVVVGWPLVMLLGLSAPAALAVAIALAMSSTAVVLRLLQQRRETKRSFGRICFGVLITQDLLVIVGLALLPPLAAWGGHGLRSVVGEVEATPGLWPRMGELALHGAIGLGGIGIMIAFGRYVLPRLLYEAARVASAEVLLVLSAAVALGAAMMAGALGFSPELGAFLAGFMLASTTFRYHVAGQLAPLRDLFMAVFFTSVGLGIDPLSAAQVWWVVGLGLVVLVIVKALTIGVTTWAFGGSGPVAFMTGMSLAQAGEFSLIILAAPQALLLVPDDVGGPIKSIVALSLILTPVLCYVARRSQVRLSSVPLASWIRASALRDPGLPAGVEAAAEGRDAPEDDLPAPTRRLRVVIAGYGVVGRAIADRFAALGIEYTVIELNAATVRRQRELGRSVIYGDITNEEVLESAGVDDADAVILSIPDDDATLRACRLIRERAPQVFIAARTTYLSKAMIATTFGADHVTVEEMATAEAMAREVLQKLGDRAPSSTIAPAPEPGPEPGPEPDPEPGPERAPGPATP